MPTPELRVVYVQFGDEHQKTGLKKLGQLIEEFFPKSKKRFCVVDNAIEGNLEIAIDAETDLVPGDNSSRDFSGYDRGIEWLRRAYPAKEKTIWIFANDTFHRDHGPATLSFFKKNIVDLGIRSKGLVGYEDCYPKPVELFQLPLQRWVRTHFFMMNSDVLSQVYPLSVPFKNEDIFSERSGQFFKTPSPLSENYRNYLKTWLFGKKDPAGDFNAVWRLRSKLSSANRADFRVKTRAILSEHYLSARIRDKGIPIVPVNREAVSRFIAKD